MSDYYLRATTAAALYSALEAAGVVTQGEGGYHVTDAHRYALDVIGAIYAPTGKMLQNDEGEVPEMKLLDGFHANLRVIDASNFDVNMLNKIAINAPTNPARGWA